MKDAKERPSFEPMADNKIHYNRYSKHFASVRNDLHGLINLQGQQVDQLNELVALNRKILEQFTRYNGGRT